MVDEKSANSEQTQRTIPAMVAVVIAVISVTILAFLVRDRWNLPEIKSAEAARHSTTGQVARAAGALVLPTDPKLRIEPKPAGPKRAQPANPL
jgi:hypothetical protein